MTYRRILGWALIAATVGWLGWRVVRDVAHDPTMIIGYGCAAFILALPLVILSLPRSRQVLQSRPQLFWFVGGGMLAISILAIGAFVALAMRDPSLRAIDGTIFGYCFVLLFGAGFMIFATPTIFAVGNAMKRSKED